MVLFLGNKLGLQHHERKYCCGIRLYRRMGGPLNIKVSLDTGVNILSFIPTELEKDASGSLGVLKGFC